MVIQGTNMLKDREACTLQTVAEAPENKETTFAAPMMVNNGAIQMPVLNPQYNDVFNGPIIAPAI